MIVEKVYLMELVQGTSKSGNLYTRAVLMDDKGRRQSFFLDKEAADAALKSKDDLLSPSMAELIPLQAEIDPFAGRLLNLEVA